MSKIALSLAFLPLAVFGQSADNPISHALKAQYATVRTNLMRSAEKVPESDYSFKPTQDVRSFGQIIGHVANAQYSYCSAVLGEKNPNQGVNLEQRTAKAELVEALRQSSLFCDKAYDGLTDATATEMTSRKTPKIGVLIGNYGHDQEHYGNLVTYMRLKNIVPPSSEGRK